MNSKSTNKNTINIINKPGEVVRLPGDNLFLATGISNTGLD